MEIQTQISQCIERYLYYEKHSEIYSSNKSCLVWFQLHLAYRGVIIILNLQILDLTRLPFIFYTPLCQLMNSNDQSRDSPAICLGPTGNRDRGGWSRGGDVFKQVFMHSVKTLRLRQNGCHHFADDILKCIFLNENVWISLKIYFTEVVFISAT